MINKMKTKNFLIGIPVFLSFSLLAYFGASIKSKEGAEQEKGKVDNIEEDHRRCSSVKKSSKTVRGDSMSPLIEEGEKVAVYENFQDCYQVKRGDLAIYNYAGNDAPLIKAVKGIPGDNFSVQKIPEKKDRYQIIINNKPVKNSEEKIYAYGKEQIDLLSAYAEDYPKIPEDSYLLLADNPKNATDSTKFGLISINEIEGVIVREE